MIQLTLTCSCLEQATATLTAFAGWKSGIKFEAPPAPEQAPAAEPAAATAEVALEDLRALLADLSQDGKSEDVKAMLRNFGVSKVTQLHPKQYAEVMAAAGQL